MGGGDNTKLIQVAKKIEFVDALKWAAKEFNITHNVDFNNPFGNELSDEEKERIKQFNTNTELFETLHAWMHELLFTDKAEDILDYLVKNRGYNPEVLKDSEFCYFPPASEIKKYLLEKHPDKENEIDTLPLFGSTADNYRLALPYRNVYGKITGFIKRATPGAVKYKADKNGDPVEERYDSTAGLKKDDIFNLNKCKDKDTIIIFEGYPDATYFYAAGMKNATAVGQGRLSTKHLESLRATKVKNVILSFYNDGLISRNESDESSVDEGEKLPAGLENTISAVKLILNESDITPFVLDPKLLDPHKDPDEYYRANGLKATQDLYKKVKKGIIWLAERILEGFDKDDFDVSINDRINYNQEKINLFIPTPYMLLNKTAESFHPRYDFPHIYKLLTNLIPKYPERKRFLNWLAGILQTRQKQLTAWVLKGEQGAGKSIFLDKVLKEMFGRKQTVKALISITLNCAELIISRKEICGLF